MSRLFVVAVIAWWRELAATSGLLLLAGGAVAWGRRLAVSWASGIHKSVMQYREIAPHPRLTPFVRTYWTLAGHGAALGPQPVLPDGCTELIVHRARPFWQHDATGRVTRQQSRLFVGQMLTPVVLVPGEHADIVAIRLEPVGAYAFLSGSQARLANAIVDVADLSEPWLSQAMRRAQSAQTADRAVCLLERALIARLDASSAVVVDPRVASAAAMLMRSRGTATVETAARYAGASPRHLERLFSEQIGLPPKRFARVVRLQATAADIAADVGRPLAEVSASSGYFDQAHMIRDFVTMTGATPGDFRQSLGSLTRLMLA